MPRDEPVSACLSWIQDEVEKIRRYLNNQQPFTPEEPLHVHFLLAGDLLRELKVANAWQDGIQPHFCDLNELLEGHDGRMPASGPFSDLYFIQQLLKAGPVNHYAGAADRRYFFLRRLRASLTAAGVVLALTGAGWSGLTLFDGMAYKRKSSAAQAQARTHAADYEAARKRLPATPVDASTLQATVMIADSLAHNKSAPMDLAIVLSRSLDRFPSIRLSSLVWRMGAAPDTVFNQTSAHTAISPTVSDAGPAVYQAALLKGRVEPFNGDFREAMDTVRRFAEDLRAGETVRAVSIVALPLDVSPDAGLQGNTQSLQRRAEFSISLTLER